VLIRGEVRPRPLELERAHHGGGEVARGLGTVAPSKLVQGPDHAGRTDVQAG
jgi:hypothetical protein